VRRRDLRKKGKRRASLLYTYLQKERKNRKREHHLNGNAASLNVN
jgi:hypothetical protein